MIIIKPRTALCVAYFELDGGRKILYVFFNLFESPYSGSLLYDVFEFIAARIGRLG